MSGLIFTLFGLVIYAVWGFAIADVLFSKRDRVRNISKLAWVMIVVVFPFFGALGWFVFGRPVQDDVEPEATPTPYPPAPLGLEDSELWQATTTPSRPTLDLRDGFETTAARERRLAALEAELDED